MGKANSIPVRPNIISTLYSIPFVSCSGFTQFNAFLDLLTIPLYLILITEIPS